MFQAFFWLCVLGVLIYYTTIAMYNAVLLTTSTSLTGRALTLVLGEGIGAAAPALAIILLLEVFGFVMVGRTLVNDINRLL